jgi:UDP-N-acetylglucosamine acyltransferase
MIHPTAVIHASAKVPASCTIGPFCVIGEDVEIGEHCELQSHVAIHGITRMGSHNRVSSFAAIGGDPQDLKYKGEKTRLEIGDRNLIREFVTINRGTLGGGGVTTIGNDCLLMAYVHIAHDCHLRDHVIMANNATLAGHATVEEWATVGAFSPVHQFTRVGAHAYVGGGTIVTQDVMPFSRTSADRNNRAYGLNTIGLERRGFSDERIQKLQHAFRVLLRSKLNTTQAIEKLKSEGQLGEDVEMLVRFIEESERGVIK